MRPTLDSVLVCSCLGLALAQYDGPVPPRLSIPGAISLGPARPGQFRQQRLLQSPPPGAIRVRRPLARPNIPNALPVPQRPFPEAAAKPVTEEPEEDEPIEQFSPQIIPQSAPSFSPAPLNNDQEDEIQNQGILAQLGPAPSRPNPPQIQRVAPPPQERPLPIAPKQYRPQRPVFRPEPRPLPVEDDIPVQSLRQQSRSSEPQQYVRQQQPARVANQPQQLVQSQRQKKPVAQVIRKYREDNEDGSITWGFENDDGSFKEETIGTDCVTRGRYGYVDPDGLKRDYSYETGIPCDKTQENQEEQGFVDYQENKAVLPNGVTIDLANMGKKARRPQPIQAYRN